MDKINELLEKYFRAESTLAEENELKNYFSGTQIAPEHKVYCALFEAFNQEQRVTANFVPMKVKSKQTNSKRLWIQMISFSGIAAALLITFMIVRPQSRNDNYAVMYGNRIEDSEYAHKYVQDKLTKVNDILTKSMKPMQNFDKVRKGLLPVSKIGETKKRINDLQNKIQYK